MIQVTCKGFDQTARMRRLTEAFVGRTYHIVGNLMLRLISFLHDVTSGSDVKPCIKIYKPLENDIVWKSYEMTPIKMIIYGKTLTLSRQKNPITFKKI